MRFLVPVLAAIGSLTAADTYAIDPAHTAALFTINHLGFSNAWGRFNDVSGSITWDDADASKCAVNIVIKAASVDTGTVKKDEHLKSPDFFSVKEFPELTFVSSKFVAKAGNVYDVTGKFTLHGVTKEITIPVTKIGAGKDPWGKDRVGFDSVFTIKRSDYGMNFMAGGLSDSVQITFASEGVK